MIKDYPEIFSNHFVFAATKNSSPIKSLTIEPIVNKFFLAQGINEYEELPIEDCFSDIEYKYITFDQIYSRLLNDIKRSDKEIKVKPKYIVTIDKANCTQRCKETDTVYDTIEINTQPFLYFIYVDISLIISAARSINYQSD